MGRHGFRKIYRNTFLISAWDTRLTQHHNHSFGPSITKYLFEVALMEVMTTVLSQQFFVWIHHKMLLSVPVKFTVDRGRIQSPLDRRDDLGAKLLECSRRLPHALALSGADCKSLNGSKPLSHLYSAAHCH